ncbi:hypothetical protein HQ560_17310, partial [bacterium]|nr:hypothetical protein [bacterium]
MRLPSRHTLLIAGLACGLGVFAILIHHVFRLPIIPDPPPPRAAEVEVNILPPDSVAKIPAPVPAPMPNPPAEIVIRFPHELAMPKIESPTPDPLPPPDASDVKIAVAPPPVPIEPEPDVDFVGTSTVPSYYFSGRVPLPDGNPDAVAWPGGAEELWVIARPRTTPSVGAYEAPGTGALVTKI